MISWSFCPELMDALVQDPDSALPPHLVIAGEITKALPKGRWKVTITSQGDYSTPFTTIDGDDAYATKRSGLMPLDVTRAFPPGRWLVMVTAS